MKSFKILCALLLIAAYSAGAMAAPKSKGQGSVPPYINTGYEECGGSCNAFSAKRAMWSSVVVQI
jgi:hypothetical protein